MPSISIGNSSIGGNAFSLFGPTGNTGPRGQTGSIGLLGITAGPTGSTGIYIKNITSDQSGFLFSLSDGTTLGPIFGFTGPGIVYSNSKGISAAIGVDYSNLFLYVTGGITFSFRGICGGNEYVKTSLSADNTEILVTIQDLSSSSILYGTTTDNFLAYTNNFYSATKTNILIENQSLEDDSSVFAVSTNAPSLNFGLTGSADTNLVNNVRTFLDSSHPYLSIPSINRGADPASITKTDGINGADSGGYILDLNKTSVFKISTPIGITSFYKNNNKAQQIKSWLFFIDGSDVWNFPPNVYFESGITGIKNYAFGPGMNILRIETDPLHPNSYLAAFVDRFIGNEGTNIKYGGIGSCCMPDGTCQDYITQNVCVDTLRGAFTPLTSCSDTCGVGSCCINGTCYDKVKSSVCSAAGGSFNTITCNLRGPCNPTYQLQTIDPTDTTGIVSFDNTASPSDKKTIAIFKAITNDTNTKVEISKSSTDSTGKIHSGFYIKDIAGVYDTNGVYTLTTPTSTSGATFALQFDDTTDAIVSGTVYNPVVFGITMKDSSGVVKASLQYNIKPNSVQTCGGRPDSRLIKTHYSATRYCRDCYKQISTGTYTYYPVQTQSGTFDFCLDLNKVDDKYVITPVCTVTSSVDDVNDCKITDANLYGYSETCKHTDYAFGSNNCVSPCNNAIEISVNGGSLEVCKGVSLEGQDFYPYWNDVIIENNAQFHHDLAAVGVTLQGDFNDITTSVINSIKNASNPANNISVLFTSSNQNRGITFITPVSSARCCPIDPAVSATVQLKFVNDTPVTTRQVRYFIIYTGIQNTMNCGGSSTLPKSEGSCETHFGVNNIYALIFKGYFNGDLIDSTAPNCLVDIVHISKEDSSCSSGLGFGCTPTSCTSNFSNTFSLSTITEIKLSDTTAVPGDTTGTLRNLIITKIPKTQGVCVNLGNGISYEYHIKETTNWYASSQQYATVELQLYQYFWYPMFCGECDGTLKRCSTGECLNICFGNGSPFTGSGTVGSNTSCLLKPSDFRTIVIEKSSPSPPEIRLTPKIYGPGPSGLEHKSNEYFYYITGQPSNSATVPPDFLDTCGSGNPDNFKITQAKSGTTININDNLNEFVVYYTDGTNTSPNFYHAKNIQPCGDPLKPTRQSPITLIKKYKSPSSISSILPGVDFGWEFEPGAPSTGKFTLNLTTDCSKTSECIDVDDVGGIYYIKNTNWQIKTAQFNVWFQYTDRPHHDENTVNYTLFTDSFYPGYETYAYAYEYDKPDLLFNNFPITGYNSAGKANIYVTLIVWLSGPSLPGFDIPTERVVEKTKIISVSRSDSPFTTTNPNRKDNTKYKLVADENGNTQCVLMDCSVTTDCNTLPDC